MADDLTPTETAVATPVKAAKVAEKKATKADTDATATVAETPKPTAKKKKAKRLVPHGHVHILASFNNTIVTVTDPGGGTLATASAGASGFRGSKKGTAYAAQVATEKALVTAKQQNGLSKVDIYVKGVGLGRDAAIRTVGSQDVSVESIKDVTGVPHGGVRPRKAKRN